MIYLDASAIVPLFVAEAQSAEASARILGQVLVASPLSLAETSSAIGRRVRMQEVAEPDALAALAALDGWAQRVVAACDVTAGDFLTATVFLRRFPLALRTPDALHLAIAGRLGARLLTFDARMAAAAGALGIDAAT